jgi:hypothetical protein
MRSQDSFRMYERREGQIKGRRERQKERERENFI